jgi:hypothetical protein
MLNKILATSALATLLATGAYAQEAPAPAADPAAPAIEAQEGDVLLNEGEAPATPPAVTAEEGDALDEGDAVTTPPAVAADDPMLDTEWTPVDLATVSADQLIGADIVSNDEEKIASVEDVLITDNGDVESIVAQFGGFLGFGEDKVVLTMDEVEIVEDESERLVVRTSLTPESIENRPEYEG